MKKRILIAGASGIAGSATVRHFAANRDWDVLAVSRRRPLDLPDSITHLPIDLTNRSQVLQALEEAGPIDHVAYAALHEEPDLLAGWQSQRQMDMNLAMVRNILDGLKASRSNLKHFVTLQGGKAYGSHLHPVPVPAKERWARGGHEIFYWPQEDLLRERQAKEGWGLTILRPSMILGDSVGSPMSIVAAIGVYASVMRHVVGSLPFPGGGPYVTSCTDSRLIAQATEFALSRTGDPEIFNVVNGDVIVWQDLWPAIASHFNVPVSEPRSAPLETEMPSLDYVWTDIVRQHSLQARTMAELVGGAWQFADYAFAQGQENPRTMVILSPVAIRQAGFTPCYDTEDSIVHWLDRMQTARLLPR